jgi:outer membrane protein assembly factor BamB
MSRFAWAGLPVVLAMTALCVGDDRTRLYSNPELPPREALDRLNLKQEWSLYVPMDGRKDGYISVQLLDGLMFVQTRSGTVAVINAETGRMLWHTSFGKGYQASFPLAINSYGVYAVNGGTIYGLDRTTGAVRWKFRQPEGLSAAPVADESMIYFSAGTGHMYAYFLPLPAAAEITKASEAIGPPKTPQKDNDRPKETPYAPAEKDAVGVGEPQPALAWETQTHAQLGFPPVTSTDTLLVPTPPGTVLGLSKFPAKSAAQEVYHVRLDAGIAVRTGHYRDVLKNGRVEDTAYIGDREATVYAISVTDGQMRWRFNVGSQLQYAPAVTGDDVYATAEGNGMFRIARATGEPLWRIKRGIRTVEANPDAQRFLAANPKFVYASDKSGRLLVLDRGLGTELSSYDTREFAFPIANEMNDRLFLAANNGLIVCLHDKEYDKPYLHQKPLNALTGRTIEDRVKLVKEALARKVTHPGYPEPQPFSEAIEKLRKTYTLQIFCSDRAFTTANPPLDPVNDKLVTVQKVDGVPLGEFLKKVFAQVGATYELTGDVIQVIPLTAKPPVDKGEAPKPEPAPEKPLPPS